MKPSLTQPETMNFLAKFAATLWLAVVLLVLFVF